MVWRKGVSGNPKGRPALLDRRLRNEINQNRQAFKELVITYLNLTEKQIAIRQSQEDIPFIEKLLGQCLEKTAIEGDVMRLRALLEIVFGKIPEEEPKVELSAAEIRMVEMYRERLAIQHGSESDPGASPSGEPESSDGELPGQELP